MDEKTIKAISAISADYLPAINAVLAKGDRVEVGPGPNGTVKIVRVKRELVNAERVKARSKG